MIKCLPPSLLRGGLFVCMLTLRSISRVFSSANASDMRCMYLSALGSTGDFELERWPEQGTHSHVKMSRCLQMSAFF